MKVHSIFNIISCAFLFLSLMVSVIIIPTNATTAHAETGFTRHLDRVFSDPKKAEEHLKENSETVKAVVEWWCEAPAQNTLTVVLTVCALCTAPAATFGVGALLCGAVVVDELIVGDLNEDCKVDPEDVRAGLEEYLESFPNSIDFKVGEINLVQDSPVALATIVPISCSEEGNDSITEPR